MKNDIVLEKMIEFSKKAVNGKVVSDSFLRPELYIYPARRYGEILNDERKVNGDTYRVNEIKPLLRHRYVSFFALMAF